MESAPNTEDGHSSTAHSDPTGLDSAEPDPRTGPEPLPIAEPPPAVAPLDTLPLAAVPLDTVASISTPFDTAPVDNASLDAVSAATSPVALPLQRLASLDALRGFDMFWIIGGEGLAHAVSRISPMTLKIIPEQLSHEKWEGVRAYDLIFPTFVFVTGVALVLSLSKLIETRGRRVAVRRVVVRGGALYLLGLLYYGGISEGVDHLRLMGVLQRIALSYLACGLLFCFFRPRTLALVCVGLLVGYWALLRFVPVPGLGQPSFEEGRNLANWVDSRFLPFHKWDGDHDPEGLLSTLPAIATGLLGVFAGLLLRSAGLASWKKAFVLLFVGAAAAAAGLYWGGLLAGTTIPGALEFPVIKKIWTSSFVLVAGGYSAILLGGFYLIMDVWRLRSWASPFVWIGSNAILLYLLEKALHYEELASLFVLPPANPDKPTVAHDLLVNTIAVAIVLAIARYLYVRKVFIRA